MELAAIKTELLVPIIAGSATILAATLTACWTTVRGRKDRQRELYGQAYEVAMAWREMVYRVRRRAEGAEAEQALVDRFHQLQEKIDFYQGWIGSESVFMCRSYATLVGEIKNLTQAEINLAWGETVRRTPVGGLLPDDKHPDVSDPSARFLKDARSHVSSRNFFFFMPRIRVAWTNRESFLKRKSSQQGGN